MRNLLNKLKEMKKDNKGFTLIEIVIVIVIIAILAAMLVPSMLKWVDSANQKSFLSAADTIRTSTNSVISEKYANGGSSAPDATYGTDIGALANSTITVVTSTFSGKQSGFTKDAYKIFWEVTDNSVSKLIVANEKYCATWTKADGWVFAS